MNPGRWWAALRRRLASIWPFGRRSRPRLWKARFVESDMLPQELPAECVVIAREGDELWSAGLHCPCGCGETIELALFPEADQRWRVMVAPDGTASLSPSVWRRSGCRSHFWLREGRVHWC